MELDPLFEDATRLIVRLGIGNPYYLEQSLKISFNQASKLLDQMQFAGIVGPFGFNGLRELYVRNESDLEIILDALNETEI